VLAQRHSCCHGNPVQGDGPLAFDDGRRHRKRAWSEPLQGVSVLNRDERRRVVFPVAIAGQPSGLRARGGGGIGSKSNGEVFLQPFKGCDLMVGCAPEYVDLIARRRQDIGRGWKVVGRVDRRENGRTISVASRKTCRMCATDFLVRLRACSANAFTDT
jgi:hypothetical protein